MELSKEQKAAFDQHVLPEVKKAIDFFLDKTYSEADFYSHILAIIRDNSDDGTVHREQMERLIFKVEQLRENQRLFHGGHKSRLSACKSQEGELDKKIMYLLSHGGYNIDRYKQKIKQEELFR